MTEIKTCPQCGAKVKLSCIHQVGKSTSKRRDCPRCGHADTVLVREIFHIIDVSKRQKKSSPVLRMRKPRPSKSPKPRQNKD